MAYKALYRTYRPQIFSEVTGQEVVVKTLQNAIINNKISHAYLFSGPRGTGKTSVARIFAKALNCSEIVDGEPCDKCTSCQEISDGINPDVIEIDAASNNGVDEIRDIREKVKFLPSGSKYKIYIIDEVHMLSGGAFNALLKTLEEPPKHVVFILATTEPQKLPATILSRCQRFEFKALTVEEISERVKLICKLEDVSITEEALNSIGESAEGGMRDALSILDQAISYGNKEITIEDINEVTGSLSFEKVITLASAIEKKDVHVTLECVNELISGGKEIGKIINGLLVFYRDVLLYKSVGTSGYSKYIFTKEKFQNLCLNIPMSKIMYFVDVLSDIQNKVRYSTTPNVFLEIALIKMCNISVDELDIMKRVGELETKLNSIADMDFSNINMPNQEVDNSKINMLDARVNQILNELNRLQLPKQIERIDTLQNSINQGGNGLNNEEVRTIENELNNLRDKVDELDLFVNKGEGDVEIPDEILARIEALENNISDNNSNKSDNNNDIKLEQIQNKLRELESSLSSQERTENEVDLTSIIERLNNLENNKDSVENTTKVIERVSDNVDLSGIYDKLDDLENHVKNDEIRFQNSLNNEFNLREVYEKINELESKVNDNNIANDDGFDSKELTDIYNRINALEHNILNTKDNEQVRLLIENNISIAKDIEDLKDKVTMLENKKFNASSASEDLSEISDKLMYLERRVYQIMAGELSNKKTTKKETKKNNGQIMLFGDDILTISNFDTNNKEKYDFEELEREERIVPEKEEVKEEAEENNVIEDNILEEETTSFEESKVVEKVIEKPVKEIQDVSQISQSPRTEYTHQSVTASLLNNESIADEKDAFNLNEKEENDIEDNEEELENKVEVEPILNETVETEPTLNEEDNSLNNDLSNDIKEDIIDPGFSVTPEHENEVKEATYPSLFDMNPIDQKPAEPVQEVVKKPVEENLFTMNNEPATPQLQERKGLFETASSITEKPVVEKKTNNVVSKYFDVENGEAVINKEHSSIVVREKKEVNDDYVLERDLIAHENVYKEEPPKQTETQESFTRDKFASYNIKYIEQILHDSRLPESRNDKIRLDSMWKVLARGADPEHLSIIEILQEGKVAVVGNKEFIIVFPNVALCNQVMRAKFKDIAIRILYKQLGDTYNYIALPIDVWREKSIEYKQQYQIGIKYPTLKPLDIKGLEIISSDEEYKNESDRAINQTIKMFGKDNIYFE